MATSPRNVKANFNGQTPTSIQHTLSGTAAQVSSWSLSNENQQVATVVQVKFDDQFEDGVKIVTTASYAGNDQACRTKTDQIFLPPICEPGLGIELVLLNWD